MQWTEEQLRAIEARGSNILLSAAAGSGKTTVLVERVLRLIREGADVDRMLIVTFTRAASADMRAKLSKELGARAAQGDERCRGQQLLLERASISTLHGFCSDFLRAHFEVAGIDPAFRVLDDAEVRRLSDEALDAALEEAYAAISAHAEAVAADSHAGTVSSHAAEGGRDPEAAQSATRPEVALNATDGDHAETASSPVVTNGGREPGPVRDAAWAEAFSALDYARGPKGVREMVELLAKYLDERPDPEAWLARACSPDADMRRAWLDELVAAARAGIGNALTYIRMALAHPDCNGNYAPALEKDLAELTRIAALQDFDELRRVLNDFRLCAVGRKKSEPPIGEEVKSLREDARKALEGIALRKLDLGAALSDAKALEPQLCALRDVALRARELFEARKAELSGLSYTDLEHRTLRALRDDAVAAELRERFDHIFVDEYQDTSDVQEALISRIARSDNLFMVGDVKQSIYRFRQAEPRLFLDKYARYGRGEGGQLLPLTMNFRSRPAILDFVNRVFECSMVGGDSEIVYDELARLNHGNRSLTGGSVELHLLETPGKDGDGDEALLEMAACEREALFIAGRIRAMMAEDPSLRYRDFAILTRAKRGVLGRMATVLLQQGIPAFADGSEAFYDSVEVLLALSLLKLTANRRSDVELIGALRSPVVGLTLNDLARIRAAFPDVPFSDAVERWADGSDELAWKLRDFLLMLERWRLQSLCVDLGALTRRILDESGLYDCVGALPGGPQRQANLDRLADNAALFDRNVSGSLTRFLKHTEKLQARGDGNEAHLLGEGDDVVRLMTAHKSKGLEFPVVFGAMLGRRYSSRASAAPLSAQRDLGLGCLYCDPKLQTRRRTLPQMAIAEREKRQDRAEELRVLYVLLTRARDRLILVGSARNPEGDALRWTALRETPGAATSYLDVILPAIGLDGGGLCQVTIHPAAELSALTAPASEVPGTATISPRANADGGATTGRDNRGEADGQAVVPSSIGAVDGFPRPVEPFGMTAQPEFSSKADEQTATGAAARPGASGDADRQAVVPSSIGAADGFPRPVEPFGMTAQPEFSSKADEQTATGAATGSPRTVSPFNMTARPASSGETDEQAVASAAFGVATDSPSAVPGGNMDTNGTAAWSGSSGEAVERAVGSPRAIADGEAELPAPDPALIRALLWRYAEPDAAHRPLKLTVTGLLREIQSPDAPEPLIERPAFLSEEPGRMSGVERGTAYHRAMQLLDLAALRGLAGEPLREAIRAQLDGFVAASRLSAVQREAIEPAAIARFLEGPLGQRLRSARELRREWSFNARMNVAAALSPEEAGGFGDGEILVQGSIDCCFQEDGRWVLLDYKTDRAGDAPALTLRYRNQLRLYAEALRNVTRLPVAEIWLCLLRSGETLPIPTSARDDVSETQ